MDVPHMTAGPSEVLRQVRAEHASRLMPYVAAVTAEMVAAYGESLGGHCEEAAGLLASRLTAAGVYTEVAEGVYCLPSGDVGHFWAETDLFVLDPTRSQFGPGLSQAIHADDARGVYAAHRRFSPERPSEPVRTMPPKGLTMNAKQKAEIKQKLVHALTAYDRKQVGKRGYNIYALAQYLTRVDDIMKDVGRGAPPRAAIIAGLSGRLCDAALKGIGEVGYTKEEEARYKNGWTYTPASELKTPATDPQSADADAPTPGPRP